MPDGACEDESVLLAAAVAGDAHALELLLLAVHDQLAASLRGQIPVGLRGVLSVEDLLQETYVRAFQGIERLESTEPAAFFSWLRAIALNRLRDAIKQRNTAKRSGAWGRVELNERSIHRLLTHLSARQKTPSRVVARREAVAAVQVALSGLESQYRRAIELRHIEGLSVAQTAEAMNRTEQAVQMLCYRGLRKLEAAMGRASQFFSNST